MPAADGGVLGAAQLELRSHLSLISTGTELLAYRGQIDESDEPLDATIAGLNAASSTAYPMAYGYSLVGRVVRIGADVPVSALGQLTFAFAPHAAAAFVDAAATQPVPPGIAAADAAFLPAAETAISIVHDAHPRAGERVSVFGAGLVGLLVVAALGRLGVHVTAVDPVQSRRDLARALGADAQTAPDGAGAPRRSCDVSIECSGSPGALQSAIDATRDAGTVVLASWYGAKPVDLSLGTRFHRSHMRLVASQVSEIRGPHAPRWSKRRRFDAAWELIRAVRPASALPLETLPLGDAAEAYARLDRGEAALVQLTYR